ncbi:MAG: ABC transporter ATP-binding protein [Firmicutes bacterium]|nr:ABC transporter ATP-binding protein [Bacillota bacterium]
MAFLEVKNVSFQYTPSAPLVLDDLSFSLEKGTVLGVLGKSGAGKSTLALALAGLIPKAIPGVFRGSIVLGDKDLKDLGPGETAGIIGLVLQNPFNQITGIASDVYSEIAFGPQNLGWPEAKIRSKTDEIIEKLGISHLADRNPLGLSGGEQQRVAIASIMVMEPELLILDEPTSQLDPAGSETIFSLIAQLKAQGTSIILIEHKVEQIAEIADHVIVLAKGKKVLSGDPVSVLGEPIITEYGVKRLFYSELTELLKAKGHLKPEETITDFASCIRVLKEVAQSA